MSGGPYGPGGVLSDFFFFFFFLGGGGGGVPKVYSRRDPDFPVFSLLSQFLLILRALYILRCHNQIQKDLVLHSPSAWPVNSFKSRQCVYIDTDSTFFFCTSRMWVCMVCIGWGGRRRVDGYMAIVPTHKPVMTWIQGVPGVTRSWDGSKELMSTLIAKDKCFRQTH